MTNLTSEPSAVTPPVDTGPTTASLFDQTIEPSVVPEVMAPSEPVPLLMEPANTPTAGQLLHQLREQANMSVQTLAATLKVSPNVLLALEADRLSELPDLVFARALAASVCRTLQVDATLVLQRMPQVLIPKGPVGTSVGLNVPMSRPVDFRRPLDWLRNSNYLLAMAILVAILVVLNWTWVAATFNQWTGRSNESSVSTGSGIGMDKASVSSTPMVSMPITTQLDSSGSAKATTVGIVTTEVVPKSADALATGGASAGTLALTLSASATSWVEVSDAAGNAIWKKQLEKGESASVTVPPEAKLLIGNAAATVLSVNGKAVDLSPHTVANIARISVK